MSTNASSPLPARRRLLLIAALFLAPLAAAFILYYAAPQAWVPVAQTQHGQLVNPARPLGEVSLLDVEGKPLDTALFRDSWTMLYIGSSNCDEVCRERLYFMRQVRTSLGRHMPRVQGVYVAVDRQQVGNLQKFVEAEHAGMHLATTGDEQRESFVRFFSLDGRLRPAQDGNVYLLDPHGNWLMYYRPQDPPGGMLKDIKKLLRLSHIG